MNAPKEDIQVTHSTDVVCDGGKGPLGHPRVYLHLDAGSGEINCPYCSRKFVLAKAA